MSHGVQLLLAAAAGLLSFSSGALGEQGAHGRGVNALGSGPDTWGAPWEGGVVRYYVDDDVATFYETEQAERMGFKPIAEAARKWSERTCVRIEECKGSLAGCEQLYGRRNVVHVKKGSGCLATVGQIAESSMTLSTAYNCGLDGILHEFGHVLGLTHVQERYDRDEFIVPSKPPSDGFEKKYEGERALVPYVPSVMHYARRGATYDAPVEYSTKDITDVDVAAVDFLYNSCKGTYEKPRCTVSREAVVVWPQGKELLVEFNAQYGLEMTAATSPWPVAVEREQTRGGVHMKQVRVAFTPTAQHAGQDVELRTTFTGTDGRAETCSVTVRVAASPGAVCFGKEGTDPTVCNGLGTCVDDVAKPCRCEDGVGGPDCGSAGTCEGTGAYDFAADRCVTLASKFGLKGTYEDGMCTLPQDWQVALKNAWLVRVTVRLAPGDAIELQKPVVGKPGWASTWAEIQRSAAGKWTVDGQEVGEVAASDEKEQAFEFAVDSSGGLSTTVNGRSLGSQKKSAVDGVYKMMLPKGAGVAKLAGECRHPCEVAGSKRDCRAGVCEWSAGECKKTVASAGPPPPPPSPPTTPGTAPPSPPPPPPPPAPVTACPDPWRFGPSCDVTCARYLTCSGHGSCDPAGKCVCDAGYAGRDRHGQDCAHWSRTAQAAEGMTALFPLEGKPYTVKPDASVRYLLFEDDRLLVQGTVSQCDPGNKEVTCLTAVGVVEKVWAVGGTYEVWVDGGVVQHGENCGQSGVLPATRRPFDSRFPGGMGVDAPSHGVRVHVVEKDLHLSGGGTVKTLHVALVALRPDVVGSGEGLLAKELPIGAQLPLCNAEYCRECKRLRGTGRGMAALGGSPAVREVLGGRCPYALEDTADRCCKRYSRSRATFAMCVEQECTRGVRGRCLAEYHWSVAVQDEGSETSSVCGGHRALNLDTEECTGCKADWYTPAAAASNSNSGGGAGGDECTVHCRDETTCNGGGWCNVFGGCTCHPNRLGERCETLNWVEWRWCRVDDDCRHYGDAKATCSNAQCACDSGEQPACYPKGTDATLRTREVTLTLEWSPDNDGALTADDATAAVAKAIPGDKFDLLVLHSPLRVAVSVEIPLHVFEVEVLRIADRVAEQAAKKPAVARADSQYSIRGKCGDGMHAVFSDTCHPMTAGDVSARLSSAASLGAERDGSRPYRVPFFAAVSILGVAVVLLGVAAWYYRAQYGKARASANAPFESSDIIKPPPPPVVVAGIEEEEKEEEETATP